MLVTTNSLDVSPTKLIERFLTLLVPFNHQIHAELWLKQTAMLFLVFSMEVNASLVRLASPMIGMAGGLKQTARTHLAALGPIWYTRRRVQFQLMVNGSTKVASMIMEPELSPIYFLRRYHRSMLARNLLSKEILIHSHCNTGVSVGLETIPLTTG
jgi:hypothetical protein